MIPKKNFLFKQICFQGDKMNHVQISLDVIIKFGKQKGIAPQYYRSSII